MGYGWYHTIYPIVISPKSHIPQWLNGHTAKVVNNNKVSYPNTTPPLTASPPFPQYRNKVPNTFLLGYRCDSLYHRFSNTPIFPLVSGVVVLGTVS